MDQAQRFLQVAILNLLFLLSFIFLTKVHRLCSQTREMRVWKYLLLPCPSGLNAR